MKIRGSSAFLSCILPRPYRVCGPICLPSFREGQVRQWSGQVGDHPRAGAQPQGNPGPIQKQDHSRGNPVRLTIDSLSERLEIRLPWACQADCGPSPMFLSPRKLVSEVTYYMVPGPSLQNSCLAGQLQHSVAKFA